MRIISLLSILIFMLHAKEMRNEYTIEFGLFGTIAKSKSYMQTTPNSYKIEVNVSSDGLAKTLSGNRIENYLSQGVIKDGLLKPLRYVKYMQTASKYEIDEYRFNYQTQSIERHKVRYKEGKLDSNTTEKLPYFTDNDTSTLFVNLQHYLKNASKERYSFVAVGGEKRTGRVYLERPDSNKSKQMAKDLHNKGEYFISTINQPVFNSSKGELYICIGENWTITRYVLKDVLIFGDITGTLIKQDIKL